MFCFVLSAGVAAFSSWQAFLCWEMGAQSTKPYSLPSVVLRDAAGSSIAMKRCTSGRIRFLVLFVIPSFIIFAMTTSRGCGLLDAASATQVCTLNTCIFPSHCNEMSYGSNLRLAAVIPLSANADPDALLQHGRI